MKCPFLSASFFFFRDEHAKKLVEPHSVSDVNHLEVERVVQDRFPNASVSQQHRRADGELDVLSVYEAKVRRDRVQLRGGELRRIQIGECAHGVLFAPLRDIQ